MSADEGQSTGNADKASVYDSLETPYAVLLGIEDTNASLIRQRILLGYSACHCRRLPESWTDLRQE